MADREALKTVTQLAAVTELQNQIQDDIQAVATDALKLKRNLGEMESMLESLDPDSKVGPATTEGFYSGLVGFGRGLLGFCAMSGFCASLRMWMGCHMFRMVQLGDFIRLRVSFRWSSSSDG